MQTGVEGREKKAVNITLMNTEQYTIKLDYTLSSQNNRAT